MLQPPWAWPLVSLPGPGLGADAQKQGHAAHDFGGNRSVSWPEAIVDDGIWTTGKKRLRALQNESRRPDVHLLGVVCLRRRR